MSEYPRNFESNKEYKKPLSFSEYFDIIRDIENPSILSDHYGINNNWRVFMKTDLNTFQEYLKRKEFIEVKVESSPERIKELKLSEYTYKDKRTYVMTHSDDEYDEFSFKAVIIGSPPLNERDENPIKDIAFIIQDFVNQNHVQAKLFGHVTREKKEDLPWIVLDT